MAFYLLKTEPSEYSFADLEREGATLWDGVTNPVAVKNLGRMAKGDRLVIYHTGDEKQVVGTAVVESVHAQEGKPPQVRIRAGAALQRHTTLAEIKALPAFRESPLVRQGRLSVVPLNEEQYRRLTD